MVIEAFSEDDLVLVHGRFLLKFSLWRGNMPYSYETRQRLSICPHSHLYSHLSLFNQLRCSRMSKMGEKKMAAAFEKRLESRVQVTFA